MDIAKKTVDPYTFQAQISVHKDELAEYLKTATDELAQRVTIDGFREGKAPKDLVEKKLDPTVVRQEALEHALGDSFTKAATQEGWDVMRTSDLKLIKNDSDTLEYSVQVQVWPVVTVADLGTVKVAQKSVEVTDAEIQEALDTVLNMRATFLDKTGPAVQGDRVEIDFDVKLNGQPIEGGQSRNHPLVIGGKNFMPGFEEALVGLAAGDTKTFSLTAPADYYEPKLAGQTLEFSVTMHRVQSVLKPAADDAFAKSLGRFENLDQLKGNLREGIYNDKANKERQRLRLAILDAIIAASTVPAPESMKTEELNDMVHRFTDDLKMRGIELPMYLARLKKTEDDLRNDWAGEAERQVKIRLTLRQISKDKNITVGSDELESAVTETIGELMRSGQLTEGQVDPERVRTAIAERLLTDKTLNFIEGVCSVSVAA